MQRCTWFLVTSNSCWPTVYVGCIKCIPGCWHGYWGECKCMVDEECAPTWLWLNGDIMVSECPYPILAGVDCATQVPDICFPVICCPDICCGRGSGFCIRVFVISDSHFVGCFAQVGHVLTVVWSLVYSKLWLDKCCFCCRFYTQRWWW